MLRLETKGTWREMGRQIGEQFAHLFERCIERCQPALLHEPEQCAPAIANMREVIGRRCPHLLEETDAMAAAAGFDPQVMFGYRFYSAVRYFAPDQCSAVCLAGGKDGPLLGYNCDLNRAFFSDVQLLRICHPNDQPATVTCQTVGCVGGMGCNDRGLGVCGASAHTEASYGSTGVLDALLRHIMLLQCTNVADVRELVSREPFLGKPMNMLICDARGDSALFEMAPGRTPAAFPRPAEQNWQACTNFFASGEIPIQPQPAYLHNAYARYGRLMHQIGGGFVEHSVAGLKQLMTDVAQPGMCCPAEGDDVLNTAYSEVMDLAGGRMHLCPGVPGQVPYEEISF